VDAINSNKVVLASAALSSITNYPRFATFAPSTPLEVAGFRIWIDEMASYSIGDVLQTGEVEADSSGGIDISGLNIDNYYSIEATSGPWYANLEHTLWGYDFQIRNSSSDSWSIVGGYHNTGFVDGVIDNFLLDVDRINNGNYSRGFFKSLSNKIYFAVIDTNYFNNNGHLGYILKGARVNGNKLMTINNASLKNICGTGIL
jgi:hypothetical protein